MLQNKITTNCEITCITFKKKKYMVVRFMFNAVNEWEWEMGMSRQSRNEYTSFQMRKIAFLSKYFDRSFLCNFNLKFVLNQHKRENKSTLKLRTFKWFYHRILHSFIQYTKLFLFLISLSRIQYPTGWRSSHRESYTRDECMNEWST